MDALVTTAFVGTAQQSSIETTTGTAIDALTQELTDGDTEHKLLLSAGTLAVYRQAGTIAETLTSTVEPAAPEVLPLCTPAIATLVENMVKGEYSNLLPEALARMQRAGQRVPHIMLATMLNVQDTDLRSAIYPLLGERGRWLSQFNPAWSWVGDYLLEAQDEGQAESIWQEGTLEQRVSVLQELRSREAAKAREWLAEVWRQEKAEARSKLLATFQTGLSLDDEETLEKVLDDRAADVRTTAANLLLRLPASAFNKRMQERAHAMVSYVVVRPSSFEPLRKPRWVPFFARQGSQRGQMKMGDLAGGKLTVTLPTTLPKDWVRDGIVAKPTVSGVSEHVWWFTQVILQVPPAHWVEHFGTTMDTLIATTDTDEEWHKTLVAAWSSAAHIHNDPQWCMALWNYWRQKGSSILKIDADLLLCMPQYEAEQRVLELFSNAEHAEKDWHIALFALPTPWSKDFSETYLQELRHHVASLDFKPNASVYNDSWYRSIQRATLALPPSCFAQARQPWTVPEVPVDMVKQTVWRQYWQQELKKFVQAIRIRQRLVEEIVA